MKKICRAVVITLLVTFSFTVVPSLEINAQEEDPSYAKWGRLAMKETKDRYSDAQIIDYLHIGRKEVGENSIEKFKLWLRKDDREFGVFVDIEFNEETEEVISINFEETDR